MKSGDTTSRVPPRAGALTLRRIVFAVVASAALSLVLASRVYIEFQALRFKVVETRIPAVEGRVNVPIASAMDVNRLKSPFAIIARIRNDSGNVQRLTIEIDGRTACRPLVQPGGPRRVDCNWNGPWPAVTHQIAIVGPSSQWTLAYFELATHHGATRSHDLIIIPARSHHYRAPTAIDVVVVFLILTALFLLPAPRVAYGWLSVAYRTLAGAVAIFLGLVLVSALVSPFTVVLSVPAFTEATGVLLGPRLARAVVHAGRWSRRYGWKTGIGALIVATVVCAGYARLIRREVQQLYHNNYSGFIHLSASRFEHDPILANRDDVRRTLILEKNGGYDAQFMYLETFDPFLWTFRKHPSTYNQFIDAPPYRYDRIGFSLLTKIASGDRWRLYPLVMMALILAALFVCALALAWLARDVGASPWWGLLILIVPGFWQSVQAALPEPLAAAGLLIGYVCYRQRRYVWAGVIFGCSLLVRETGALLVVILVAALLLAKRRREAFTMGALALVPLVLWRGYVGWMLWPVWGVRGLFYSPHDFTVPFVGMTSLLRLIHLGQYYPGISSMARAGVAYVILLTIAWGIALALWIARRDALGLAAAAYATMAVSLDYRAIWVHVGNAQRGTYEIFAVLALLSIDGQRYSRALRIGIRMFWVASAAYVIFGAFDAEYIRNALLWPLF